MGSAWSVTPSDMPRVINQPAGAYGDSIGGMTIAGGIAGALFARERTGETSIVDVSLMSVGAWMMGLSLGTAMLTNSVIPPQPIDSPMNVMFNPTIGMFRTSDDRFINLTMLQPGRYFADVCRHLGIEHLLDDERFSTAEGLMANASEAGRAVTDNVPEATVCLLGEASPDNGKPVGTGAEPA